MNKIFAVRMSGVMAVLAENEKDAVRVFNSTIDTSLGVNIEEVQESKFIEDFTEEGWEPESIPFSNDPSDNRTLKDIFGECDE